MLGTTPLHESLSACCLPQEDTPFIIIRVSECRLGMWAVCGQKVPKRFRCPDQGFPSVQPVCASRP